MDHVTFAAHRLDHWRSEELIRDAELLRRQAARAAALNPIAAPARVNPFVAAWRRFRVVAHLGHPVAH